MTVSELMSKLAEVSKGNPDMEVEIRVLSEAREISAEILEDAMAGEEISVDLELDEYAEEFSVEQSRYAGWEKVCICTRLE